MKKILSILMLLIALTTQAKEQQNNSDMNLTYVTNSNEQLQIKTLNPVFDGLHYNFEFQEDNIIIGLNFDSKAISSYKLTPLEQYYTTKITFDPCLIRSTDFNSSGRTLQINPLITNSKQKEDRSIIPIFRNGRYLDNSEQLGRVRKLRLHFKNPGDANIYIYFEPHYDSITKTMFIDTTEVNPNLTFYKVDRFYYRSDDELKGTNSYYLSLNNNTLPTHQESVAMFEAGYLDLGKAFNPYTEQAFVANLP